MKFAEAAHHVVEIDLWLKAGKANSELIFPVWTPGSYMVREYTRNIESIQATAHEAPDQPAVRLLPLKRSGKNRWLVQSADPDTWVRVTYRLYCRELSVRTNWVEAEYGFITGAATFPMIAGRTNEPVVVQLELPSVWQQVATSLMLLSREESRATFQAASFDELVDSPIVCGDFELRRFEAGGKPHYLANVCGYDLWDLDVAVSDTRRIVEEHQRFWGEVPYDHYWFLNLVTDTRGGLEHDSSTVLMANRWTMLRRETYLDWLALVSHEFFHTWNVRRLRPKALMQYDYEQEQFLEELWIAEGITSYFDDLALVRTGLCTCEEFLARLSKTVQAVQNSPGRLVQDLRDASWDSWVKHYRPDENTPNSRISYYLKGALLAWLLDTRLQRDSAGKVNLDCVMRALWKEFRLTGYTLQDFEELVERLGSRDTRVWLEEKVRTTSELDFTPALEWFGLHFRPEDASKKSSSAKVWIGSQSTPSEGKLIVRNVFRGSPSDRAGMNVDDELVALDGYRLTPDAWPARLELYHPGQEMELLVARRGRMLPLTLVLGEKPDHNWELAVSPSASSAARDQLQRWLRLSVD